MIMAYTITIHIFILFLVKVDIWRVDTNDRLVQKSKGFFYMFRMNLGV